MYIGVQINVPVFEQACVLCDVERFGVWMPLFGPTKLLKTIGTNVLASFYVSFGIRCVHFLFDMTRSIGVDPAHLHHHAIPIQRWSGASLGLRLHDREIHLYHIREVMKKSSILHSISPSHSPLSLSLFHPPYFHSGHWRRLAMRASPFLLHPVHCLQIGPS